MIEIDGSQGEGGGQILRTALALSLVTGKPFRIANIRAGRKKPGLLRQHLTAINAATEVGHAKAERVAIGSRVLTFHPGTVTPGTYEFAIGTAGSATLVLQTILPGLLCAGGESTLTLEGGTHNPFAPPFDYLQKTFLPQMDRLGAKVEALLERPGFYPAGGGRFRVFVHPSQSLAPFDLVERGAIQRRTVWAVVAGLPEHIARRETARVLERLTWPPETAADWWHGKRLERPQGPGNVVLVEIASEMVTEVFTGFGEKAVPAEAVADVVVDEVREYLASDVPVGRHLADQLLVPLAMAVSQHPGASARYRTLPPTRHTTTNIAVIRSFLGVDIQVREAAPRTWEILISHRGGP